MDSKNSRFIPQTLISVLVGCTVFFLLLFTVTLLFAATISSTEVGIIALIAVGVAYARHRLHRRRARPG